MSVETVNGAVLIPHRHDWSTPPKGGRNWVTEMSSGVTGAEDRASVASIAHPWCQWRVLVDDPLERHQLVSRVVSALKSGAAAVPEHGREYYLTAATGGTSASVGGVRSWAAGEWVLIRHPSCRLVNRVLQINCGAAAVAPFLADQMGTGGSAITTASSIDVSGVADAAPENVYKSAREIVGVGSPGVILYTLTGFQPGVAALVRLHFAEIDTNMGGTYHRKMDISVVGQDRTDWASFEIYVDAGALNKATVLECYCTPSVDGKIVVTLTGVYPHIVGIPSAFYYPACISAIEAHQISHAARQLTGDGVGSLTWTERLRSIFPIGSDVTPLIFGRLSLDRITAVTSFVDDWVPLRVEAPVSTGSIGIAGTCPADSEFGWPIVGDPGDIVGTRFSSSYWWGLNSDQNPNDYLMLDQVIWSRTILLAELGGSHTIQGYFWEFSSTHKENVGSGLRKWVTGSTTPISPTDYAFNFEGAWTLVLIYTA